MRDFETETKSTERKSLRQKLTRLDKHFVKPGVAIFGTGKVGGEGV